jgi:phage-related protein
MSKDVFEYNFAHFEGKVKMQEFLDSLDYLEKAKIIAFMDKLVEMLNVNQFPNEKLSKYLRDGIFELKVHLKNKISRSLYFFMTDKNIIFTHGFIKKTEKTPDSEIEKAIKIKEYYRTKI